MLWQRVRTVLLAGGVAALAAASARAEDGCAPAPCAPAPQFRTVTVKEWVPEQYPTTRTVYKTECRTETVTAYRCETVPETRTRTVTTCKSVPTVETRTRTVCVNVPTVETRTVQERHVTCKPVTTMCRRCVDRGHWECRQVPCETRRHWRGLFHHRDCEDECAPACPPPMKTVRVWVPCPTWETYPVTKVQRVCEYRPVQVQVTVCKKEYRTETYQVTVCKSVAESHVEKYTVCVTRKVPYQTTRQVAVCVPHEEKVMATRMVCRTVEKQVPCEAPCETTCCKRSHRLFRGHHGDCCE
jgi:hypothetical protein